MRYPGTDKPVHCLGYTFTARSGPCFRPPVAVVLGGFDHEGGPMMVLVPTCEAHGPVTLKSMRETPLGEASVFGIDDLATVMAECDRVFADEGGVWLMERQTA